MAKPEPTKANVAENAYVFERDVTFQNLDGNTSIGRIDLYKRGCFVLEAKQGSEQTAPKDEFQLSDKPKKTKKGTAVRGTKSWDDAMVKARGQAEQYARALPTDEGWPPFLIVVDVGHSIELFADFTRSGKTYLPFPDPGSFRISMDKLADVEQRQKLRDVWTQPLSLDPSRRSAKVTRELADKLARLAKSLESSQLAPGRVAQFLMRCLFTMFAEDVELIPKDGFKDLLVSLKGEARHFPYVVSELWKSMNTGAFWQFKREKLKRFNGGLFEDCEALPLTEEQLALLIEASKANWREVEPAIFGTLLERALDPIERHKLGAHYTPRAYVERLVMPTIIEPLREEWDAVRTAAVTLATRGESKDAVETLRAFHRKLCETHVLDPACGSGNFLYVALEHMKRLEGEILNTLRDLGYKQTELITVDPHQFLGIEVNPRAAAIADLVLWIGYLQWHLRTRDLSQINEPIIRKFHNIECRDAVLAWSSIQPVLDENLQPVTRWDGRTTKPHPVTGEQVPDESSRVPVVKYLNPRKAEWPQADYIVGNPPFIGKLHIGRLLGEGYVETLRAVYEDVPDGADYVMYWWHRAAVEVSTKRSRRFGLITTNSIRQPFNRRVLGAAFNSPKPIHLAFAVPDHPWVDGEDGAAVRIAMTVGALGHGEGLFAAVSSETETGDGSVEVKLQTQLGMISEGIRVGANLCRAVQLAANSGIASMGPALGSRGFVIDEDKRNDFLSSEGPDAGTILRPLRNGRDLLDGARGVFAIDFSGYAETQIRNQFPRLYQHLYDTVRPERLQNRDERLRANWWQFRRSNELYRSMLAGLSQFVVTVETAKYRLFFITPANVLAEHGTISFGIADTAFLGILSSRIHVAWSLATGGTLEDRPRYNKTLCFETFPFPAFGAQQTTDNRIRELGEQLDAHRKRQQALHPGLTMTGMYNVLEKLRSGEPLTDKERIIHEQGLVSVLKQIHDELDAAVFEAYGWPVTLTDEEILERLVALNAERAAEEERGLIRWLRPEFQNPAAGRTTQTQLAIAEPEDDEAEPEAPTQKAAPKEKAKKLPLPDKLPDQVLAIRQQLASSSHPVTAADMAKRFAKAKADRIEELLQTMVIMGNARQVEGDKFVAA